MRIRAVVLVCLALLGHGRRVQKSWESFEHDSSRQSQKSGFNVDFDIPQQTSLVELRQSQSNRPPHNHQTGTTKPVRNTKYPLGDAFVFPAKLLKSIVGVISKLMGLRRRGDSVESPSYTVEVVVASNGTSPGYEVRRYGKYQIVSTGGRKTSDRKEFMMLAGYIGAAGPAQNSEEQKISMTAPVISDGKRGRLSFTLPSSVKNPPDPLNRRVLVEQRPEATWAVHRYSGNHDPLEAKKLAVALRDRLANDGYKTDTSISWEWWRYNDPRVAPELKRNEVAIRLQG